MGWQLDQVRHRHHHHVSDRSFIEFEPLTNVIIVTNQAEYTHMIEKKGFMQKGGWESHSLSKWRSQEQICLFTIIVFGRLEKLLTGYLD